MNPKRVRFSSLCVLVAVLMASVTATAWTQADAVPTTPPLKWWKGNIHTHTLWSDGNDFPEMVAEWYRTHDYNFLALSDHNVLSEGIRWMPHDEIVRRGGQDALEKYQQRFGNGWVETRGEPGTPTFEVRLKPWDEFRPLVEERGRFIMIQGEEISDSVQGKPLHLNATNLKELVLPLGGATIREAIENNLRAVQDQARRTGRDILLHLNHPNFGLAVTAEDLAAVIAERFFEVYNGHPGVKHLGDEHHPAVERLWDIANTIRLGELNAAPLLGIAVDDSHTYHGSPGSRPGRGWIMVRSHYLTPESLISAIRAGDFYASSGVTLSDVRYDRQSGALRLTIQPEEDATYVTQFIGTLVDYDKSSESPTDAEGNPIAATRRYSSDVGQVLATVAGLEPQYTLTGRELYVRAVVTSSLAHADPSFANQRQQAWTQPIGWRATGHAETELLSAGPAEGGPSFQLPPAPAGYKTREEVLAAIASGALELIDREETVPQGVEEIRDLQYARIGSRVLHLDLDLPSPRRQNMPGLIFIHGGAWSGGSRSMYHYYTRRFAAHGFAAATISYRLSDEAVFPAAVEDVKCAVRWMRVHAGEYGIDPERIALVGGSAGGHLAMLAGYTQDHQFTNAACDQNISSRVQAVVNLYGPVDLTTDFAKKSNSVQKFLGTKFDEDPDRYRLASPIHHLDVNDPPTLVIHGTIDEIVPVAQADGLVARLVELSVPHVYDRLEGWPHALDVSRKVNEHCQQVMLQFFQQHLTRR